MDSKNIQVYPLGAGQDVGRSCIIIKIYDKIIMLDCGLHMSINDQNKYPNFDKIKQIFGQENSKYTDLIDLVLISHFHLDHIGALPYFTEIYQYDGPIYMTAPTKALYPYMCEDFRKVVSETYKKEYHIEDNNTEQSKMPFVYSQEDISKSFQKVSTIQLLETIDVNGIKIKPYYAGHVLGAAMFLIEYKGVKVVYTGDFHSNADRHLGAAWIDKVKPDLLISECTYGTVIRESKRSRERIFLKQIQETIDAGGKVLIPVFALGRAQELCILLETYWQRTQSQVPVYFAAGMIEKANFYYKLFVNWTNEKIKNSYLVDNMFNFKHIKPFQKSLIKTNQPMVLFATPGMLHAGLSMQVFKEWCQDEKNTLIIPGYCVAGTLGNKLLSGCKQIVLDKKTYDINIKIKNMSFSAHADAKGILGLIKHCETKNVMLVHGDLSRMMPLAEVIKQQFQIGVFTPANFELISIPIVKEQLHETKISQSVKFNENQEGIIFQSDKKQYQIITDMEEFQSLLDILAEQYEAYWHRFEQGYILRISQNIIEMHSEYKAIKKDKIIGYFQNIIQEIIKIHDDENELLTKYLSNNENFDVIDEQFLIIKKQSNLQQQQNIDYILNLLNIYNSKN